MTSKRTLPALIETEVTIAPCGLTRAMWDLPVHDGLALDIRCGEVLTRVFHLPQADGSICVIDARHVGSGQWAHRFRYFEDRGQSDAAIEGLIMEAFGDIATRLVGAGAVKRPERDGGVDDIDAAAKGGRFVKVAAEHGVALRTLYLVDSNPEGPLPHLDELVEVAARDRFVERAAEHGIAIRWRYDDREYQDAALPSGDGAWAQYGQLIARIDGFRYEDVDPRCAIRSDVHAAISSLLSECLGCFDILDMLE
jgi:hypothetical protein